ncbi:hypothetical protein TIFTF001_039519 [Ficus carica]|uniref:Uncharacterized protein n=1 Tax=Ficus carica TaxID=3494 RepID=A0AA88JFX7_FICCA|nr:hypothetical protein TIFTF001_039519 [Ficus carica]
MGLRSLPVLHEADCLNSCLGTAGSDSNYLRYNSWHSCLPYYKDSRHLSPFYILQNASSHILHTWDNYYPRYLGCSSSEVSYQSWRATSSTHLLGNVRSKHLHHSSYFLHFICHKIFPAHVCNVYMHLDCHPPISSVLLECKGSTKDLFLLCAFKCLNRSYNKSSRTIGGFTYALAGAAGGTSGFCGTL